MRTLKRLRSYCYLFVIRTIVIGCLCAPVMLQAQISGNYTIDSRQPTAGRNFRTFSECVNFLSGGLTGAVTVDVAAGSGPYNEPILLTDDLKTSVTKTLIFNCNGVTLTWLSVDMFKRDVVQLNHVSYVTIDKLVIVPTATSITEFGVGVHITNDADHNTIRNCTILNNINSSTPQNNEGIVINGSPDFAVSTGASYCDYNLIINNTITGGFTGITFSSVPTYPDPPVRMTGNQIIDNKISNNWFAGIFLYYNDDLLVQGNDIQGGLTTTNQNGMVLYEGNQNTRLIGNKVHNFATDPTDPNFNITGIDYGGSIADAANPNLVANNLIYDFSGAGTHHGISAHGGGSYLNIYHNTISFENTTVAGSGNTYGMDFDGYSDINIWNNIITIKRTTTGDNIGLSIQSGITRFTSERNLFYVPSGSTGTNAVGDYGGAQTTLVNWRTKTGRDLFSVSSDPKYKDPVTFNLIPTDSAIDNLGQFVNISNDIAGAVRNNQHPDIGAYEFFTPACVGPAVGGTATLLPGTTICEGAPMALNLTGNSFGLNQTYQWQTSSTINGTYTNVGQALPHPATSMAAVSTLYYRAAVTCNSQVDYSTPVLVTVSPMLAANTYTINSNQPTGGNNFHSYNDALNAIRCGIRGPVVFDVVAGSGPYNEQVIIPQINGSSATNTVTFKGNNTTLTYLSTNTNERAVVKLNGTRYFILDNINIVPQAGAGGQYGTGVQLINDADHNTVKNCTITLSIISTSTNMAGIVINPGADTYDDKFNASYCDSNTITGNTITGGNYGITCTSISTVLATGNTITNNIIRDFRQYGISIGNTKNTLIEGNDISRPTRTNNASSVYGIYSVMTQRNLFVSRNRIHNTFDGIRTTTNTFNGIWNDDNDATMTEPIIISNNLLYSFSGAGNQVAITNLTADSVQYYHNTVSLDDVAATTGTSITSRGFFQSGQALGIIFKDNNIIIRRGGTGQKHCIYMNTAATTYTSDYNNFLITSTGGTKNMVGFYNTKDYATVALWQAGAGKDANSISLDPVFQNPTSGDYTPTVQAFDNKGIPVGITTDIKNLARHAKPDIGAFEFSFCLALTKPVVKATDSTTSQVTFKWNVIPNATGYLVSTDGINFTAPSSGVLDTTHIVSNITGGNAVTLTVIALGTTVDCPNDTSAKVTGHTVCLQLGTAPVAKIDTATTTSIRFSWTAVANASGYKVAVNGGNFVTPSAGAAGLYHVVSGLTPGSDVSFIVQAQGSSASCPTATSNKIDTKTPNSRYFVPNAFTPNNNGNSDKFEIESHEIRSMRLLIFNQWGQKIFESSSQQNGWDGTFNGKQQPVGVYVYVLTMTMMDGTVENKKGTISLIR